MADLMSPLLGLQQDTKIVKQHPLDKPHASAIFPAEKEVISRRLT